MPRVPAREHALFGGLLAVAVGLRVITLLGYPGVAWFGDSGTYLRTALDVKPSLIRPSGYSLLLFALRPFHSMVAITVAQQILGLATGVLIYLIVRMKLTTRWAGVIGTLAAAPVLLDAYQLQLEHLVMADELFAFLLTAVIYLIMRGGPLWAAGLLLAAATLTRSVGLPFLLIFLVYLLVQRVGWRRVAVFTAAFAVPMIGYVLWFHADHKTYSLTRTDQIWLYGRTVDFADCSIIKPRAELLPLCPDRITREPGEAVAHAAIWGADAPLRRYPGGVGGVEANKLAGEFARLAIEKQPLDYIRTVSRDTVRAFAWARTDYPNKVTVDGYRFPAHPVPLPAVDVPGARQYGGGSAGPRVVEPFAGWARWYQGWAFVPGTVLGLLLLAGLAGMARRWRECGGLALLPWSLSLALLVVPAATADFDYRYVLPAVPLAALAAALAWAPRRPTPEAQEPAAVAEEETPSANAA
jgi:hypothetical protein